MASGVFPKRLSHMSFDELAECVDTQEPGTMKFEWALSEVKRRQAIAQIEAAEAALDAAEVQKLAASAQTRAAQWLVWAVSISTGILVLTTLNIVIHAAN